MGNELDEMIKEMEKMKNRHPEVVRSRMENVNDDRPLWYYECNCDCTDGVVTTEDFIKRRVNGKFETIVSKVCENDIPDGNIKLMASAPDLYTACMLSRGVLVGLLDSYDFKESANAARAIAAIDFAFSNIIEPSP